MLGGEEIEDINDPPSPGLTIGNFNESLRLGLLMLSKQHWDLNSLVYTCAQNISKMKSFLAECKKG